MYVVLTVVIDVAVAFDVVTGGAPSVVVLLSL